MSGGLRRGLRLSLSMPLPPELTERGLNRPVLRMDLGVLLVLETCVWGRGGGFTYPRNMVSAWRSLLWSTYHAPRGGRLAKTMFYIAVFPELPELLHPRPVVSDAFGGSCHIYIRKGCPEGEGAKGSDPISSSPINLI